MSASFTVKLDDLKDLIRRVDSPTLRARLYEIPRKKEVAAIVAQGISDNFDKEGPGWAPLKASTIRRSVSKTLKKKLSKMTDKQVLLHERRARAVNARTFPYRQILKRSGLLHKLVTTPNASGVSPTDKSISGKNIWQTSGTKLIWGTDLIYAGVQNYGSAKLGIPARPFLVLSAACKQHLFEYVVATAQLMIDEIVGPA